MSPTDGVTIENLRVVRGGKEVLHGISLDFRPGEITGLLGPSGCGKTTMMRAIAGVQRVAGGSVTILGLPAGSPALRRRLGYVTQAPSVYSDLTVAENLRYFGQLLGVSGARQREVMAAVRLEAEANLQAAKLSGGQLARVSLATALLNEPEVLVLDEPTVGLDPVLRKELWRLFHELAARGAALLISSHVMDEAERCDRLVLMRDGRILALETLSGLLRITHTTSVEDAFLALVGEDVAA